MGVKKLEFVEFENMVAEKLRTHLNWERISVRDGVTPQEVLNVALAEKFTHQCQPSHPYTGHDLNTAAVMLSDVKKFLAFPLASILTPQDVSAESEAKNRIFGCEFSHIRQKAGVLGGIKAALETRAIAKSIFTDVLSIADELATNAVFNAPFVDLTNSTPGASRADHDVHMHAGRTAQVFLGGDEARLVVGCRDPYGTLNLVKLFERIKKCYDTSVAESMNKSSAGGAGIGSFMVFAASASYYAVVDEGHCTMICCVLPVKMSSRARAEMPKNLHFIIKKLSNS